VLIKIKTVISVAKKQHHLRIKLTGILTLSVLLAVKISLEGLGNENDSMIFFVAL
jgi:hypothetical protein